MPHSMPETIEEVDAALEQMEIDVQVQAAICEEIAINPGIADMFE